MVWCVINDILLIHVTTEMEVTFTFITQRYQPYPIITKWFTNVPFFVTRFHSFYMVWPITAGCVSIQQGVHVTKLVIL
jgi:hypothetical protein